MDFLRKALGIQENDEEKHQNFDFEWISLGKWIQENDEEKIKHDDFSISKIFLNKTLGIPQKDEKNTGKLFKCIQK